MAIIGTKVKTVEVTIYKAWSGKEFEIDHDNEYLDTRQDIIDEEGRFFREEYFTLKDAENVFTKIFGENTFLMFQGVIESEYNRMFIKRWNEYAEGYDFDYFNDKNIFISAFFEKLYDEIYFDYPNHDIIWDATNKAIDEFLKRKE